MTVCLVARDGVLSVEEVGGGLFEPFQESERPAPPNLRARLDHSAESTYTPFPLSSISLLLLKWDKEAGGGGRLPIGANCDSELRASGTPEIVLGWACL